MGVFDTHAHYDSGAFNQDRLEVLAGLPEQGVELIVNPGCDLPSSRKALELAHTFPFVYAAVGIHPSDCGDFEESQMGELEELARDEKVKAIGEIGLDYHWEDNPPKEHQKKVFALQMELAEKLVRLSGYEPYRDIDIIETGLRPGEKLYEELLIASRDIEKTENEKIFVEHQPAITPEELAEKLEILRTALEKDPSAIRAALHRVVPTFREPEELNSAQGERVEIPPQ